MRSLTDRRGIPTHGDNAMARIRLLTAEEFPEQLRAAVGADTKTPLELGNLRFYAHRPELAEAYVAFMAALRRPGLLSRRLVELVRLRVAFHNQCRSCMAVRYHDGAADGVDEALAFLRTLSGLYVVKTDGLAAGKGVLVTESLAEAEADVRAKLAGVTFGEAGRRVIIEEGLSGPEVSLMCVCDGQRAAPLASAQDFKRVGDGDVGPNTGGMGAYSPVPAVGAAKAEELTEELVMPTLHELRRRGVDYRGVLYAGLMLTPDGPKVLEYNVRFGDPETQVVLPRWSGDVAAFLAAAAAGSLGSAEAPQFDRGAAVTVVCASEGYPQQPRTGDPIAGLETASAVPGVQVFCAGVGPGVGGSGLVTAGGRVLNVTAVGDDVPEAHARAYEAVALLSWPGMVVRRDIAAAV